MGILNNLFTGVDNTTHDLGRVSWAGSWAALTATACWNAWHGAALDLMTVAGAYGAVAAAHSAAIFAKQQTEPKP